MTIWVAVGAALLLVISLIGVRRKARGFDVGFVPWHGLLLFALVLLLLMAAHLTSVWPR